MQLEIFSSTLWWEFSLNYFQMSQLGYWLKVRYSLAGDPLPPEERVM